MQTLEINYKVVFENLPGRNMLLFPDPPFFTVAAISKEYINAASLAGEEVIGKPIMEVFSTLAGKPAQTILKELFDSIEFALVQKEVHNISLSERHGDNGITKQYKISHIPVCADNGEVLYIVHSLASNARPTAVKENNQYMVSDHNLQTIIRQAPVGMGILRGADLVVEVANAQLLNLWGKGDDIIGLPLLTALPEIVDQPFPDLLKNVFETGSECQGFEQEAMLKRGGHFEKLYFNFNYAPLKDDHNTITGVMVIGSDVTNLVKARKALEETEKRYRDLIGSASVATAVYVGEDMEIKIANDAMIRLWGKDPSVIGKPVAEAIPELKGQPFMQLLAEVYRTGVPYKSTEDRADLIVDGRLQTFYFNFTYQALRNIDGEIYGILNMAVDVTDSVKVKMRLNDQEQRLRIAVTSAELGTWDYYPLTDELICSPRTKTLFGFAENVEVTLKTMISAINVKDRKKVEETIEKALKMRTGKGFRIEYEVVGIEGDKSAWHRATGTTFFNDDGVAYRLSGTVLDITERKRIEEALEERVNQRTSELLNANRELERSNRELEQYAYVASHDLQEPLRKILVYTDLLVHGRGYTNTEHNKLEKIMSSAQRMSLLIKDLLNFSRLLKSENIFSAVDLKRILRNVIDDFELKINETNATITVDELPQIEASPQQMNQLFYNLINNALKFVRQSVPPRIHVSAVLLTKEEVEEHQDLNSNLQYVDISVADNGIGFNPRYVKQIFEIFKRLHTQTTFEGTGIGLALCRKIALNHHGDIYAESKEGEGSVFHVLLPLRQIAH